MPADDPRPTAIDLFCGAGGLTLGLREAGFNVVAGVEFDERLKATYERNNPGSRMLTSDLRALTGADILKAAGLESVDLVAGCPPCQGFSKLTDKCTRRDPRNGLVLQMARIIAETQPRIVMMENVSGLAVRGRRVLDRFVAKLRRLGYIVDWKVLQLADFGVPQSRRRLVLLAGRGFSIPFPGRTHAWRVNAKTPGVEPWLTVADAIAGFARPATLTESRRRGGPQTLAWHVVRDVRPLTLERLRAARAGKSRMMLPEHLRPPCHAEGARGFENVYSRMRWRQTPPTMTAGCTTFCKGRFGHPTQLRTISVREAARIQGFPDTFEFVTDEMDLACAMVGNALPPKFAEIVARQCSSALSACSTGGA